VGAGVTGETVGSQVGLSVGSTVGSGVGLSVGSSVTGALVGSGVGDGVGSSVGPSVGASVGLHTSTTLQGSSATGILFSLVRYAQHSAPVSKEFGPSISESYPLEHLVIPSMATR